MEICNILPNIVNLLPFIKNEKIFMKRCDWAETDPLLQRYHDEEWAVPVHNDREHYMYLLMENMSCGLSWLLMLKKREVFRECFAGFDFEKVAQFSDDDVQRIMNTENMIRSRRKIEGMIANARAFIKVREEFGSFDRYIWSFTKGKTMIYPSHSHKPVVSNALSDKVAKDMKKRGFKFIGSVITYSHLQAIGIIDDHLESCCKYKGGKKNLNSL